MVGAVEVQGSAAWVVAEVPARGGEVATVWTGVAVLEIVSV